MGRITRATRAFGFVLPLATGLMAQDAVKHHAAVPLYFEENRGQTNAQARYIARSPSLLGFVTQDGWTLSLSGQPISMHIAGANAKATLVPENPVEGITNYYLASRTITNLAHYSSVRAQNIRPKIDVIYHGNERDLEYDLVVHPGADLDTLWLRFDGSRPALAGNGDIVLKTGNGEVRQHKPRVWQEANGLRTELECSYVIAKSGRVGFVLSNYDRSADLIVDPIISYSTYLSGTNTDTVTGIAVDGSGYAYITGNTYSADFPVTFGAYHTSGDVFVTKLNPGGTGLIYSTYIGGTSQDSPGGIALDNAGNAYVTGYTNSSNFPVTVNQFNGGQHAFVLKLDAGGSLLYSTALAGNNIENGLAVAVDASGSAY
ncbi:MAG TPA: SBBP repeat-containing protein, partial [Bryobacteraceae bacterium]